MGSVSKPFQTREGLSGFFSGIYVHSRIFWILGGCLFFSSSFYFLGASTFFSIVRSTPTFSDSLFSPPLCIIISGDTPVRTRARRKSDRSAWVFLGFFFFFGGLPTNVFFDVFPLLHRGTSLYDRYAWGLLGGEMEFVRERENLNPYKERKILLLYSTYFLLLCPSPFYSPQSP